MKVLFSAINRSSLSRVVWDCGAINVLVTYPETRVSLRLEELVRNGFLDFQRDAGAGKSEVNLGHRERALLERMKETDPE